MGNVSASATAAEELPVGDPTEEEEEEPLERIAVLQDVVRRAFAPSGGAVSDESEQSICGVLDTITCMDCGLEEEAATEDASRGLGHYCGGGGEGGGAGAAGSKGRAAGARGPSVPYKKRNYAPAYSSPCAPIRLHPPITYLHIAETAEFSIGIFCLPAGATIPLHNHPGMTVLSRLLYGTLHVRAYDWHDQGRGEEYLAGGRPGAAPRNAVLVRDTVLQSPCKAMALHPADGGNIHALTALAPSAVLDVMGPPYARGQGRDCTYYSEVLSTAQVPRGPRGMDDLQLLRLRAGIGLVEGQKLGIPEGSIMGLVEMEAPSDFVVRRGEYRGQTPNPINP